MKNKNNDSGNLLIVTIISCFIIFLVIGFTLLIGWYADETKRGTFGDMFGFANALFTGLSLIGLIVTITLQRQDLNAQREELKEQTQSIHVQNFENTFFQMLSLFNSIVNNTKIELDEKIIEGRQAFNRISELIYLDAQNIYTSGNKFAGSEIKSMNDFSVNAIITFYTSYYDLYKEYLAHYFRTFYHIIKFIDRTDNIDKRTYIALARAQLSSHDIVLFLYNGLHHNGLEKFKPLIEEYTLFNNIDDDLLINLKPKSQYSPTAFNYLDKSS